MGLGTRLVQPAATHVYTHFPFLPSVLTCEHGSQLAGLDVSMHNLLSCWQEMHNLL